MIKTKSVQATMMWLARFFLLYLSYSHAALDISITPKYLSTISKKVSGKSPNFFLSYSHGLCSIKI